MNHTNGFLARGGLAAALLLLGIAVARPASADLTITISRVGTVSGGVATISGWVTTDATEGEYVTVDAELTQYLRSSPKSPTPLVVNGLGLFPWQGFVPAGVPTPWIVNIYPFGSLAFRVGPAYASAGGSGEVSGDEDVAEGTVGLKRP